MVHDRIAAGETTVISTAAVLRCGKQMGKLHIITFPGQSIFKNRETQSGRDYGPAARQTNTYLLNDYKCMAIDLQVTLLRSYTNDNIVICSLRVSRLISYDKERKI
jgi:hypothetical protein